jgi:CelD/BcsL family acetyltransferase involved in cellulose biosynthesis
MSRKTAEKEKLPASTGNKSAAGQITVTDSRPDAKQTREKLLIVKTIRTREELRSYAREWNTLLSESQADGIFLTWEWLSTWIDIYLGDNTLLVIAVYRDDLLIGMAPLWVRRIRRFGVLRLREVCYLGTGEVCSDHLDMILHKEHGWDAAHAIWDELFGPLRREWDILRLEHTPQHSPMVRVAHHMAQHDTRCIKYEVSDFSLCPYVVLPASYDNLLMSLGQRTRFNITKSTRLLEKQGSVTFASCENEHDLDAVFPWIMETHQKTWSRRGKFGGFALPRFKEFHLRVSRLFLSKGWLSLATLRVNSAPLAATYSFMYHGTTSGYLAAIDFEADRRLSIGRLLLARSMQLALEQKNTIFDMLRGEEPYKYHWTNRDRRNISMALYNGTLRSMLAVTFSSVRNIAKALFRAFVGGYRRPQQAPVTGTENLKANLHSD